MAQTKQSIACLRSQFFARVCLLVQHQRSSGNQIWDRLNTRPNLRRYICRIDIKLSFDIRSQRIYPRIFDCYLTVGDRVQRCAESLCYRAVVMHRKSAKFRMPSENSWRLSVEKLAILNLKNMATFDLQLVAIS